MPPKIIAIRDFVEEEGVKLEDASVVVCGGRGIGGSEGFTQLEELAKALRKDKTTVFRYLQKLKENFVIERIGSNKIGHWIILREVEDSSS